MPSLTKPEEILQYSEELSTLSYQQPNKPSPHLSQYLYNTDFQKSSDVGRAYQNISYPSYMTNHYQHARNYHANATKVTKYIKHYKYKMTSLKSATKENET